MKFTMTSDIHICMYSVSRYKYPYVIACKFYLVHKGENKEKWTEEVVISCGHI